jgi:hypothetical protein
MVRPVSWWTYFKVGLHFGGLRKIMKLIATSANIARGAYEHESNALLKNQFLYE